MIEPVCSMPKPMAASGPTDSVCGVNNKPPEMPISQRVSKPPSAKGRSTRRGLRVTSICSPARHRPISIGAPSEVSTASRNSLKA